MGKRSRRETSPEQMSQVLAVSWVYSTCAGDYHTQKVTQPHPSVLSPQCILEPTVGFSSVMLWATPLEILKQQARAGAYGTK